MDGQAQVVAWLNGAVDAGDHYLQQLQSARNYFAAKKQEAEHILAQTLTQLGNEMQEAEYTLAQTQAKIDEGLQWFTKEKRSFQAWLESHPRVGEPVIVSLAADDFDALRYFYDSKHKEQCELTKNDKGLWRFGWKSRFLDAVNAKHSALLKAETVHNRLRRKAQDNRDATIKRLAGSVQRAHAKRSATIDDLTQRLRRDEQRALRAFEQEVIAAAQPAHLDKVLTGKMAEIKRIQTAFTPATTIPMNIAIGMTCARFGFLRHEQPAYEFLMRTYANIRLRHVEDAIAQPFMINLGEGFSLFFRYRGPDFATAMKHIQNICLRSFLSMPPSQLMFHFIDSSNAAQTFALFRNFEPTQGGYSIIDGGIQVREDAITRQLQIIVDYISDVNINTFRGVYPNIREYNKRNPAFPMPYYVVGIMGYPAGFTGQGKKLLQQIIAGGRQCGVYVVVMADRDKIESSGNYAQGDELSVMKGCDCFDLEGGYYRQTSARWGTLPGHDISFIIQGPLAIDKVVAISAEMKGAIKQAGRLLVTFSQVVPPAAEHFRGRAEDGFSIPIGMTGASEIMPFEVGQPDSEAHHMLICGATGSGKSRLLHALIVNALLKYDPAQLDISLVDFKQGTEFKIFSEYNLPVFRLIAIEAKQEFGVQVLREMMDEVRRRGRLFRDVSESHGGSVVDLKGYNASVAPTDRLPRMLVILDEFHVLFSGGNAKAAADAGQNLEYLLTNGRAFGVHVILGTQSMNGVGGIPANAMAQIGIRVALKCAEEDAAIVLGPAKEAIRQIAPTDPGSAIIIPNYTKADKFHKMRVALLSGSEEHKLLKRIEGEYRVRGLDRQAGRPKPRVLVSRIEDTRGNPFQAFVHNGTLETSPFEFHPGEPLDTRPSFQIKFARGRPSENLLIAGDNIDKHASLQFYTLLDLALSSLRVRRTGAQVKVEVIYFDIAGGPEATPARILTRALPSLVRRVDPADAVAELGRLQAGLGGSRSNTVSWLVFANLNYMDALSAGAYSSTANGFDLLERVLREGPTQMMHVAASVDDLGVFVNLYPNVMTHFGKRVAFDLPEAEAKSFARAEESALRGDAACLITTGAKAEFFRPYLLPGREWQKKLYARFKALT